jgi:hypothetical protein
VIGGWPAIGAGGNARGVLHFGDTMINPNHLKYRLSMVQARLTLRGVSTVDFMRILGLMHRRVQLLKEIDVVKMEKKDLEDFMRV